MAELSRIGRDIADGYPPPGDLARRGACERDFRRFCETYFPAVFYLPWADDQLRVIERIQSAVLDGGLFALAMPRSGGKTSLCERAVLWALLYGHRRFVCLVAATEEKAEMLLEHAKMELMTNELLGNDFRQVCYPIQRLENNARRCIGQLFEGEPTRVVWAARRLTLPNMPKGACDGCNVSGSTVTVAGITGALRGQSHLLASGEVVRPELVILDDPQTRESANSPSQCAERLAIVLGDVLGMAGPKHKIAAIMPCTVIRNGDLADELLDRDKNPQWQGERTRAVYAWPQNEKYWDMYFKLRAEGLRTNAGTGEAQDYYVEHRAAMDAGARVAWPARFDADEVSAIQHFMNLRNDLRDEAFFAEYQNEPLHDDTYGARMLTTDAVMEKLNGVKRGVVPMGAEHLTAFVDVHDTLLYWLVAGWSGDFTGSVVDYGTYPGQRRRVFTMRKAAPTLGDVAPGAAREGAILAGLVALVNALLSREWEREDGVQMRIGRCLIDAGYVPDIVYDFCRRSEHAAILLPSRGEGITAKKRPMTEYQRKPGERFGWHWLITRTVNRATTYLRLDSNHWKTFVHARLAVALGDSGALSLYGHDAEHHRLLADHLTAEVPTPVTANGRTVNEWSVRPGVVDNHWLDCLVGCTVGASMMGASIPGMAVAPVKRAGKRRIISLAQAMGRGKRM